MTLRELDRANELQKEIRGIAEIGAMLERTIEWEKKQDKPIRRMLRFLNKRKSMNGEVEARALLFVGGNEYGSEIPVDLEFLEYILPFFEKKFQAKQAEFDALCTGKETG